MSNQITRRSAVWLLAQTTLSTAIAQAQTSGGKSKIDPKAKALLKKNAEAMLALKSYSAECWTTLDYAPSQKRPKGGQHFEFSELVAIKPNKMRYNGWAMIQGKDGKLSKKTQTPIYIFVCDGKQDFRQFGDTYRVTTNVEPHYLSTILEPWNGFYTAENALLFTMNYYETQEKTLKQLEVVGQEKVEGQLCDVIAYEYHAIYNDSRQDYKGKIAIGKDGLVRRKVETVRFANRPGYTRTAVLRNIRTNFPTPSAQTFVYTPPPGVKKQEEIKREPMLADGTIAPDFTANDIEGKPIKLSDYRGKVVVVDFWATWCGPCIASMPHTNEIAKQFKDRGVVVLAVNVWDEPTDFKAWIPKNSAKYDSIQFAIDPDGRGKDIAKTLYKVSGIPTQYVVDKDGVIRASFLGAPPKGKLEEVLSNLLK
jgi:thiol-disulfide isomerase/thioredoxin